MGRGAKALAVSLALILGVTACSRDYTLAYLYVTAKTSATTGLINAYAIDYQTGSLLPLADSPIPTGKNPVALTTMPDGTALFVANHDDSTIEVYNIGTDGKLYQGATYNTLGSFPTALAVDGGGKFLYATTTYQGTATSGTGGITIFPINEATNPNTVTLGTATTVNLGGANLGNSPIGITVSKIGIRQTSAYVLVADQETTSGGTPFGIIRVFQQGKDSSGNPTATLTAIPGTASTQDPTGTGFAAGTSPGGIAVDPSAGFVYVTDKSTNQIYTNTMIAGVLAPLKNGSPTSTGQFPLGLNIDPRGQFLYVANYNSNTVSGYTISTTNGSLTAVGTAAVATGPTCVAMENALGAYLYTSNQLDDSVSGERYDAHTGSMTGIQGTQFSASHLPTCAVAIANGSHATQLTVQ